MSKRVAKWSLLFAAVLAGLMTNSVRAQSTGTNSSKPAAQAKKTLPDKTANKSLVLELTAEREQTALQFAQQHHPELVQLLEPLKQSNPQEYLKGIRELARTSDRLMMIQQREPSRYAIELDLWKANSQIRLLGARLSMAPSEEIEGKLKSALKQQHELKLSLIDLELKQVEQRQSRLTAERQRLQENPQAQIDREYEQLLKRFRQQSEVAAAARKKLEKAGKGSGKTSSVNAKTPPVKSDPGKPEKSEKPKTPATEKTRTDKSVE